MISWFEDKEIGVFFDDYPRVKMRYALPSMTTLEKNAIAKYPFENKRELKVSLFDNKKYKKYEFTIRKNYCWDGASIPRMFWRLIGAKTDSKFLIPSLIHDVLCENHSYIDNDREFSTKVFNALLIVSGVNKFNRFLMKNSVNFYQLFCKWGK